MSMLHNALPYLGQVLLVAVLATVLFGKFVKDARQRMAVVAVLTVLGMLLPVSGLTFAQWLRSVVGDLSVLTFILFLDILAQRLSDHRLLDSATRNRLLSGVVVVGVVFYPLALGVSKFDPYRLGYDPVLMTAILCLVSVFAWMKAYRGLAIILPLPLIAFNLQLLESTNLWDYLLDPIVMIYAVVQSAFYIKFLRTVKWSRRMKNSSV